MLVTTEEGCLANRSSYGPVNNIDGLVAHPLNCNHVYTLAARSDPEDPVARFDIFEHTHGNAAL